RFLRRWPSSALPRDHGGGEDSRSACGCACEMARPEARYPPPETADRKRARWKTSASESCWKTPSENVAERIPPPLNEMPNRVSGHEGRSNAQVPDSVRPLVLGEGVVVGSIWVHGSDAVGAHPADHAGVKPAVHEQWVDTQRVLRLHRPLGLL